MRSSTFRWVLRFGALAPIAVSLQAQAWIDVCDGRKEPVTVAVAIGAKDPPGVSTGGDLGVTVEGWWTLAPGQCVTVSEADASQTWMYFYAKDKAGLTMKGDARLCVRRKPFKSGQRFLSGNRVCVGEWSEAGFVRRESGSKNFRFHVGPGY